MANENDILVVSANIDASGATKGGQEFIETIDRMDNSVDGLTAKYRELYAKSKKLQDNRKAQLAANKETEESYKKYRQELAALEEQQKRVCKQAKKLNATLKMVDGLPTFIKRPFVTIKSASGADKIISLGGTGPQKASDFVDKLRELLSPKEEERVKSVRQQITAITQELELMEVANQQDTKEYQDKLDALAKLNRGLNRANANIKSATSNGSGFQAFGEGVGVATGAVTAATGALSLFGATSKSAQEITAKLTSVMSISMGIQQMMAVTYETSALKAKLLALYKKANAKASIEESAANVGATATTGALAAGETVATGTTITLTGAMKALGVAIKSVPILGWVAAIGGGAVVATSKYISRLKQAREENEKLHAQKMERTWEALNTPVKNAAERYADARVELESLLGVARDANVPLEKQREAYEALDKAIPGFNSALDATASGYESNTSALYKYLGALETLYKYEAAKDYLKSLYEQEIALETNQRQFESWVTNRERLLRIAEQDADKFVGKSTFNMAGSVAGPNMGGDAGVAAQLARGGVNIAKDNLYTADRALSGVTKKLTDLRSQIKIVEGTVKGLAADASTVKPFDTNSSSTSPSRGGSGGGPTKNELYNEAYLTSIAENEDEVNELRRRNELLEGMESQHQQRLLDIREDGYSKSMALLEKELDDEIDEIKESLADEILTVQQYYKDKYLEEEKIRAEKTKGKITPWDDSMLADNKEYQDYITELLKRGDVLINDAQKANVEKQKQVLKELLASYQDFEAQKLAAEIKFNEQVKSLEEAREAAQKEGRVEDVIAINASITALQSKYRESVGQLTAENFFKTSGLDRLFGNISMLSSRQLGDIQSKLKERMSQGGLGIDEYETLAQKAQEVEDLLFSRQKKAYNFMGGTLMEVLRERARLTQETADAEEQLADAEARLAESAASVMSAKVEIWNALGGASSGYALSDITTDNQKSILANNTSNAALPALFAKLVGVTQQQQENGAIVKERKSIVDALKKRENETPQEKAARQVATANYAAGQAREAAGLVDKLKEQGVFGSGEAAERIGAAFSSAASAGEAYAKFMQGDFVGALSSGLDAVLNLFTVFGIGEGNMAELQEEIDHLTAATADLSSAFTLLSKELEESTTLTAKENKEKAIANLQQQKESTQKTAADRLAQWERGSRSLGSKVNRDADAQAALREMGLSSVYDLTKLSSEQLQDFMKNYSGGAWTTLMDSLRRNNNEHNGDAEAFISELEFLSEIDDKITEVEKKAYEKYTGFTFQGLKDSFVSTLQDMNSSLDDFAAEAEKKMNNIAVQKIADSLDDDLEGWYKEYAKAIEDAGENGLTPEQEANFKAEYDAIVQKALDQREAAEEAGIITQTAQNKAGMTKGFGSMTVEQADYLTGTFTSVMVSNQGILVTAQEALEQIKSQSITSVTMGENVQQMRDTMTEMRDIQQEGLQYTKQIAEYTLNLVVMKSDIERMRVALETKL